MDEVWVPAPGFEGFYDVSNLGRVRSLDRYRFIPNRWGKTAKIPWKGRILNVGKIKDGSGKIRPRVIMCSPGRRETKLVHVLVCTAFHGPRPAGLVAAHRDGDTENNKETNLRWATQKENMADTFLHGTNPEGSRNPNSKLSDDDIRNIRSLKASMTGKEIAKIYGISKVQVFNIVWRKQWAHVA